MYRACVYRVLTVCDQRLMCAGPSSELLVCVPHRPSTLPVPWEEVLNGGGGGSESGQATPDADEYDMRLGQLQVRQRTVTSCNPL